MKISPEYLEQLMSEALLEAVRAKNTGEVPIGAVVSLNGEIISRAHNEVESTFDATAHAECLALRRASEKISNWRLSEAVLCVTLEPCTMCIGAIRLARIPVLVFGADDPKLGAVGSIYDLTTGAESLRVIRGIREKECGEVLSRFFESKRR